MPVNLAAAALAATGFWAISAYTIVTHDGAPPRELWTVTSSNKNPSHPTLARASVPRSLTSACATTWPGKRWRSSQPVESRG